VTSLHSPSSATPDDVPTLKEICATGEFCAPTRRCRFIERIQENCCIVKLMRCPRATVTVTSLQFVFCFAIFILLSLQSPTKINWQYHCCIRGAAPRLMMFPCSRKSVPQGNSVPQHVGVASSSELTKKLYCKIDALSRSDSDISATFILLLQRGNALPLCYTPPMEVRALCVEKYGCLCGPKGAHLSRTYSV